MPLWGKIMPKIGIKTMVAVSGAIAGIGLILMSSFTSLMQFYIAAFFVGVATPAMTILPTSILINNWFVEKKGLAMGLAMSFSGLSAALLSPIVVRSIQNSGWGSGYRLLGVMAMVMTIPIALFVLKAHPAQVGLTAYGAIELQFGQQKITQLPGVPSAVAFKSGAFFGIAVAILLIGFSVSGFSQHLPAHLVNKGFTPTVAGSIMSVLMLTLIVAKISVGFLNDRLGTSRAATMILVCAGVGFLLSAVGSSLATAFASVVLFAMGLALTTVFPPLVTAKMFGAKDFSSIYSLLAAIGSIGYAVGTPVYGMVFDRMGSYALVLYGAIIMIIIAGVLVALSISASEKLPRSKNQYPCDLNG